MKLYMKSLFACCVLFLSCRTMNEGESTGVKFYGTDSKMAEMTFQTHVDIGLDADQYSKSAEQLLRQLKSEIDEHIRVQLAHMFGTFTNHTKPFDFVSSPGIPRERPRINDITAEKISNNTLRVSYKYTDITVFKKDVFTSNQPREISFYLPERPGIDGSEIYMLGCANHATIDGRCASGMNRCTDEHYNTLGDFWYFWNPHMNEGSSRACPITSRDLVKVNAKLKPLPSTRNTFPDYERLYPKPNERRSLKITYLIGIDESFRNGDLGKAGFQKSFLMLTKGRDMLRVARERQLLQPGEIELLNTTPDVKFNVDIDDSRHKRLTFRNDERNFNVIINMYLVDPNRDFVDPERPDAYSFPKLAADGMRDSDVFIYDGHSGLGGYLSVGRLFARRSYLLPVDKYQIFYFNGCSTFSYYNYDYFDLKKVSRSQARSPQEVDTEGTKNLDILTTSIGSLFETGSGHDAFLIRALTSGEMPSWQTIIDRIYSVSPEGSALVHVNGDEDNPKKPTAQCTSERNQWQHPTRCECSQGYKYHQESGFCRKS